jgi:hypothetical protein
MKKLLIVGGIIVLLVAAYFVSVTTLSRQVRELRSAVRAGGHPMTLNELETHRVQGNEELSRLLAQADTALDEKTEKQPLAQADSGKLDAAEGKALLARNGRALDLLLSAARFPPASIPFDPGKGIAAKLPATLKRTFDFGALLRLKARDLLDAGKADEAMDVLVSDLHLADLLPGEDAMIFALARSIGLTRTLRVMRDVGPKCSDQTLARAADAVASLSVDKEWLRVWEVEYVMMDNYLARPTVAQLGLADADNLFNRMLLFFPLTNLIGQYASQVVHKRCLELAARPWYEANRQWDSLDRRQQRLGREHSPLAGLMLPNGKPFATRLAKLQAERAVTLTGYRILQYRPGHATFPATLADIQARDVIDPFTGKSLNYRPVGTGFRLYSTGEDQQDNGGDPKADIAWSVEKVGAL